MKRDRYSPSLKKRGTPLEMVPNYHVQNPCGRFGTHRLKSEKRPWFIHGEKNLPAKQTHADFASKDVVILWEMLISTCLSGARDISICAFPFLNA